MGFSNFGPLTHIGSFDLLFLNSMPKDLSGLIILLMSLFFKDLSPVIRSNLSYLGLLGVHSEKHIKQYAEELSAATGGTEESFYRVYNEAKKGNKFDFLLLDFRKLRAFKNLDKLIYDRDSDFKKDENKL